MLISPTCIHGRVPLLGRCRNSTSQRLNVSNAWMNVVDSTRPYLLPVRIFHKLCHFLTTVLVTLLATLLISSLNSAASPILVYRLHLPYCSGAGLKGLGWRFSYLFLMSPLPFFYHRCISQILNDKFSAQLLYRQIWRNQDILRHQKLRCHFTTRTSPRERKTYCIVFCMPPLWG